MSYKEKRNIGFGKIQEIYGEEYLELINENLEDVKLNIEYMQEIGFKDTEDLFERCTPIFIQDNEKFKGKLNNLIRELGYNYIEIIESDLGILEELE